MFLGDICDGAIGDISNVFASDIFLVIFLMFLLGIFYSGYL